MLQQPLAWLRANMHLPYKVCFGGTKFGRGWGQLMYGSVMLLHAASAALISSCGNLVGHFFSYGNSLSTLPIICMYIAYYPSALLTIHHQSLLPVDPTTSLLPISTPHYASGFITIYQHSLLTSAFPTTPQRSL